MKEGKLIWITGLAGSGKTVLAKKVFHALKIKYPNTIHLDGDDMRNIWGIWAVQDIEGRKKMAMSYAKMCSMLTTQGINVVMSTVSLFYDIQDFNRNNNKKYFEILLKSEDDILLKRYNLKFENRDKSRWINQDAEFPGNPDLILNTDSKENIDYNVMKILDLIRGIPDS